jgi:hypothetical protein
MMTAEFLQKKVWLSADGGATAKSMHLIIRRTRTDDGKSWAYKYSLSNAPAKTSTQRLAYQQAQRFWVEQAIKDAKDGLVSTLRGTDPVLLGGIDPAVLHTQKLTQFEVYLSFSIT